MQFAFTVSAHIIFPAILFGLASFLAVLNGLALWTGRSIFLDLSNYWKRIIAVAFGVGVISGSLTGNRKLRAHRLDRLAMHMVGTTDLRYRLLHKHS